MDNDAKFADPESVGLAVDIVSAYVANNAVSASDLPVLIANVHAAVLGMATPAIASEPEIQAPAVSVKNSVMPDYLVSLEDGRHYKSLKRHLSGLGLTPDTYRQKWGLPSSYPMVAPAYAKRRSELAKSMGLGRRRGALEASSDPTLADPAPSGIGE